MTSKRRALRAAVWLGAAVLAALAYAGVVRAIRVGLRCPFWRLTGLYCPGCGVSRMCLRLLELDVAGAFRANRLLFLALPLIGGLLLVRLGRYVAGKQSTPRWEERTWVILAIVFLGYGLLRNLPAFSVLAPL